jgi:TPR repeat protein
MNTVFQTLLAIVLALSSSVGWSKTTVGETVSTSVTLESGDVFSLPEGYWEAIDKKSFSDAYNSFDVLVLRNANPDAAVPLLVIRQTPGKARWKQTNCDYPSVGVMPAERFGTKSSDMVTKCARMWKLGSYAGWLQSKYARDEPWWKGVSEKFPDLGSIGSEPMVLTEFQVTHFNMRVLQIEAFVRTAQLGISPETIQQEANRGLSNPIHVALDEWRAVVIEAADTSVFGGKAEAFNTLEKIYSRHGLVDASLASAPAEPQPEAVEPAVTPNLEELPAYSRRWSNDPDDAKYQAGLAWVYRNGDLAPKDLEHAYELFRRSAEQGDAEGMRGLAWTYLDGLEGLPRNEAKGFEWMQKASAQGNADATADLGHLYRQAMGVAQNSLKAVGLFRQAYDAGSPMGAFYLAQTYRDGRGVSKDETEAAYWFTKAAKQGLAQARNELAGLPASKRIAAIARLDREDGSNTPVTAIYAPSTTAPQLAAIAPVKAEPQKATVSYANRKALVIGNDQYHHVNKLLNARADAKAVSSGLARLGYKVTTLLDLNEREMKQAVREFKAKVQGGDEVLFYYAGHGVQLGNANYLLPIDIKGDNEDQVKDEAIQLQRVLDDLQERRAKFTLAVIDACRDNPFKSAGRAIGGRGLAPTTAATGQMIIFSAGSGQQALDKLGSSDRDPNSIFTRTFIREMDRSGVSVDRVLRNVRNQVVELARSVGHEQVPALYDQAVGDFYFRP